MDQLSTLYSNPNGTASQGDMKIGIDAELQRPSLPPIYPKTKQKHSPLEAAASASLSLSLQNQTTPANQKCLLQPLYRKHVPMS